MNQSWRSGTVSRFRFFGDGDSSIDRANEINLSSSSSFQDSGRVSENNPDYYRFTLRNSSSVKFNFQNRGEESIRFSIVDRTDRTISINGKRLFADLDSGNREKLGVRFSAGTYFIRIKTSEGNDERYSFRLRVNSRRNDD
ncbi:MAG: hypothetical protein HC895_10255 [Leptolyngbyaceae cyanobacterium SM1_3_5]|nr:hypothetical protein [Leptolyngbyaceae cyanobacterium SM1_3_5]